MRSALTSPPLKAPDATAHPADPGRPAGATSAPADPGRPAGTTAAPAYPERPAGTTARPAGGRTAGAVPASADPSRAAGARPAAVARRAPRSLGVSTQGAGEVRVRRVTLGGIARAAERLRAAGEPGPDALVDALIAEALAPSAASGAGGAAARRLDPATLARLSDEDKRAIAVAMLTLEGVKADGADVHQDPRAALAQRYGPIVGSGERVGQAVQDAIAPLAGRVGRLGRTFSAATIDAIARGLAGSAALREVVKDDDWLQRLRQDPEFALDLEEALAQAAGADAAQPDASQMALFELPPLPAPPARAESPARGAGPERSDRAGRAGVPAETIATRVDALADSHRQLLAWHGEARQTTLGAITDIAARADASAVAARRNLWLAGGALALALVVGAVALIQQRAAAREHAAAQAQLQAQLDQQERVIRELQRTIAGRAAATAPRAATPAPAPAPAKSAGKRNVR